MLTLADRLPVSNAFLASFRKLPEAICNRCGRPWVEGGDVDGDESVCSECRERGFAFDAREVSAFTTGPLPGRLC
jgi:hypothetical protein